MDRVVALRNGFAFGISMSSSRIANYESINGGNLHGWFTGDGMTYLYMSNNVETQFSGDFWPTVDPYHLPGTTVETNSHANSAGEASTTGQNWVGGAQVKNTYGVAGMQLHGWNTTLYAKKSWFMLDDEIVCLGAGITCGGPSEVDTTAEDRRLGNPITNSFTLNGVAIAPAIGWSSNLPSATPSWCALGGAGGYYFPAGNSNLQAVFLQNTGSWSQINSGDSTTVYTDNYLKLWFNHGLQPANASYSYVILPSMNSTSVSNYALSPDMVIITNTPLDPGREETFAWRRCGQFLDQWQQLRRFDYRQWPGFGHHTGKFERRLRGGVRSDADQYRCNYRYVESVGGGFCFG